jgi:RNA polymerase sigma-70 factor (ECF subfamily)
MNQDEPNKTNDKILLQQLEEGSTRAFDQLFEKYWQQAYSSAYKRLKNHDDAKDIVQEVFTHIWIKRQTTQIENFPAYLHVAIRNRVIKFISKQKQSHPFFDLLDTISAKNLYADSSLLWKEFMKAYESLLETLPPKRQAIFRLRYERDLSTRAISKEMGINRKTVQNQLGKAVETLKVSLLRMLAVTALFFANLF